MDGETKWVVVVRSEDGTEYMQESLSPLGPGGSEVVRSYHGDLQEATRYPFETAQDAADRAKSAYKQYLRENPTDPEHQLFGFRVMRVVEKKKSGAISILHWETRDGAVNEYAIFPGILTEEEAIAALVKEWNETDGDDDHEWDSKSWVEEHHVIDFDVRQSQEFTFIERV